MPERTSNFVLIRPNVSAEQTWAVTGVARADGETRPGFSSLPNGESNRGLLRSPVFQCPLTLSFWLGGYQRGGVNRVTLRRASDGAVLREQAVPGSNDAVQFSWQLAEEDTTPVYLELEDTCSDDAYAWLAFTGLEPAVAPLPDSADSPLASSGWTQFPLVAEEIEVDGIPFVKSDLVPGIQEGEAVPIEVGGLRGQFLYLLGGLNSVDLAHPAWGGGDGFRNFFLGDSAGELRLEYADGTVDTVPLVFGYTVWWKHNFRISPEPFASDAAARATLDRALCVANGIELLGGDAPLYLRVALRDQPLDRVVLHDSPERVGHFVLDGMTVEVSGDASGVPAGLETVPADNPVPPSRAAWLRDHTVIPHEDPFPDDRAAAIAELAHWFYATDDDITAERVLATPVDWSADNFSGPHLSFSGSPEAMILERVYYENAVGMAGRIEDDTGMVHESAYQSDRFDGFGGWTPDLGPYYDAAYTRFRGLQVLGDLGFDDKVEAAIGFFDKWLMYFPESYPELQLGGKPVPGHATVIANQPHIYFDFLRHHGWPTKYETRDFGNPENDGHGLLMLARYRAWAKEGRDPQWVRDRWDAIVEAAEYIPWALDNPELSFSEHGLMYNETEGGMLGPSSYCDICCYLGLVAYAEMADGAGEVDKARRWRAEAQRLFDAMEAFYPLQTEQYGEIWDPHKDGGFHHGLLASLYIGMDYWGFDVANRMPDVWKERTANSFRHQLPLDPQPGISNHGIGYGQNYFIQSALLLDRFDEAEPAIDWLARACFAPRLEYPFRVPEGFIGRGCGTVWRRWGDLGNLYQLVETMYTILLMTGVDDIRPGELLVMPRYPRSWESASARALPVRTNSGGESTALEVSTEWRRSGPASVSLRFESTGPVDNLRLRIGPLDTGGAGEVTVVIDGAGERVATTRSGDTEWVWLVQAGVSSLAVETMP